MNESTIALVQEFGFFVKGGSLGVAPTLAGLPGSISSVAHTAKCEFYCALQCTVTVYVSHQCICTI